MKIPENLPADRTDEAHRAAELNYWVGVAQEALGDSAKAKASWERSVSAGSLDRRVESDTARPRRRADSEKYYQALAFEKLGQTEKATPIFRSLVESAAQSRKERPEIDFSASLEQQQSRRARLAQNHYLAGLGYLGLGEKQKAKQEMAEALKISPDNLAAKHALASID